LVVARTICHVLLADPDLGAGLDERRLQRAEQECLRRR